MMRESLCFDYFKWRDAVSADKGFLNFFLMGFFNRHEEVHHLLSQLFADHLT